MTKDQALKHWQAMTAGQNPLKHMNPIPYKAEGSKYGACGIRIDGTPEFIDAVLSNLKSLIDGENHVTRLELSRREVDGSGIGKATPNKVSKGEVCYIRLHMRGREAVMMNAMFDRKLASATDRFEELYK